MRWIENVSNVHILLAADRLDHWHGWGSEGDRLASFVQGHIGQIALGPGSALVFNLCGPDRPWLAGSPVPPDLDVTGDTRAWTWMAPAGPRPGMLLGWGNSFANWGDCRNSRTIDTDERRRELRRAEELVGEIPDPSWRPTAIRFAAESSTHVLFERSWQGSHVGQSDHLRFDLEPGEYDVATAEHPVADRTRLIAHRFARRPQNP